jgi:hypothetical protein
MIVIAGEREATRWVAARARARRRASGGSVSCRLMRPAEGAARRLARVGRPEHSIYK